MARYKTPELIVEYVKAGLIHYGEIPFLYHKFEPTNIPSKQERSSYKVVSALLQKEMNQSSPSHQICSGLFRNQAILNTILMYYGKQGIKQYAPMTSSPGKNPVGALALICTAVWPQTMPTALSSNHLICVGWACAAHALHWVFHQRQMTILWEVLGSLNCNLPQACKGTLWFTVEQPVHRYHIYWGNTGEAEGI